VASLIHPQNSSSQKSSSPAYPSPHKPKLLHLKLPPANLQLSCNSKQKNGAQNANGKKKRKIEERRRKKKLKARKEQRVEHDED
jgi:hypothetical protein